MEELSLSPSLSFRATTALGVESAGERRGVVCGGGAVSDEREREKKGAV